MDYNKFLGANMFKDVLNIIKSIIHDNKKDFIYLFGFLLISAVICFVLLKVESKLGVYSIMDVFGYLNNALSFAGFPAGAPNCRGLSPLVPFLTSILFRLGWVSETALMFVTAMFYVFGGLGFYLFLRLKFNEELSLFGAILFITSSINIIWATKGMIDIPGVSMSIWFLYFVVLSFDKNPKYLYLAFPFLVLSFFTRFTTIFMLPIAVMYWFFTYKPFIFLVKNIKDILVGFIIGIITLILFLGYYILNDIPMTFLYQTTTFASSSSSTTASVSKELIVLPRYYLDNLMIGISTFSNPPFSLKAGALTNNGWIGGYPQLMSYIVLFLIIIAFILYIPKLFAILKKQFSSNKTYKLTEYLGHNNENSFLNFIKNNSTYKKLIISPLYVKNPLITKMTYKNLLLLKIILCIIFLTLMFITLAKTSVIITLSLFLLGLLMLFLIFNSYSLENASIYKFNLDLLVLAWFFIYFIFFTLSATKVTRYITSMIPAIIFLAVLGLYLIFDKIDEFKYSIKIKKIVPFVLIFIMLCSTAIYSFNSPTDFNNEHITYKASFNEKDSVQWLKNYDSDYLTKKIWADRGTPYSFYMKKEIPSVYYFSNHLNYESFLRYSKEMPGLVYSNETNFEKLLINNEVDYYISVEKNNYKSYKLIKSYQKTDGGKPIYIYKKHN